MIRGQQLQGVLRGGKRLEILPHLHVRIRLAIADNDEPPDLLVLRRTGPADDLEDRRHDAIHLGDLKRRVPDLLLGLRPLVGIVQLLLPEGDALLVAPLPAFGVSLPALGTNLVNLAKTTTLAYAIAVPELLYVSAQIWSEQLNVREMMNVVRSTPMYSCSMNFFFPHTP